MKSFVLVLLITPMFLCSQQKTLIGKVKSTREKLYFVTDSIQNYKLFNSDGDYGHSGFTNPQGTVDRFYDNWFNEVFVHYINNKRFYNEKRLLISEDWFYKDDKQCASYEYKYTDFDSLCRITKKYDNVDYYISNISYNHKKLIQSKLNYWTNNCENFSLKIFNYNEKYNLIGEEFLTQEGKQKEVYYTLNKLGLQDKTILHKPTVWAKYDSVSYYEKKDSIGTYFTSLKKYFNKKKQMIKSESFFPPDYDSEGGLSETKYFEYDERGNCIETRLNFASNPNIIYVQSKEYDRINRKIKEENKTLNSTNTFDYKKEFFYNDKGELYKLIVKSSSEKEIIIQFEYKYDSYNNWIEQSKFVNGKKLFIWKREIEYY